MINSTYGKRNEKNHKRILTILLVVLILGLLALVFVSAAGAADQTLTCKGLSQYLGTDGAIFYDGPVIQCDVFVAWDSGVYGDVWASTGLDNSEFVTDGDLHDFDDEVDLTVGWAGDIGNSFGLDVGVAYYAVANPTGDFADILNPYIKLTRSFSANTLYLKGEWYWPVSGSEPLEGEQYRLGVRRSFSVSDELTVNTALGTFFDTGAFGFEKGFLSEGSISFDWGVGVYSVGAPFIRATSPISDLDDGRETDLVFGITVSKSF